MNDWALNKQDKLLNLARVDCIPEIFDLLGINYTIIDTNGNYIAQSKTTISNISLGLTKAQDIDLATWQDCLQVMEHGKKSIKEEFFRGKYYLSIKQPIFENNTCVGILVVSLDISERKQAEIAKAEFLRNMNHDIRTPFTGILGIARYLQCAEYDDDKKVYLNDLVDSSERLLALMNQVLEISCIDSQPLVFQQFNIREVIDDIIKLMMAAIRLKGLAINLNCPHFVVNNDKDKVSRILINLISNAIKFTENGFIDINVETQPALKITIQDTGIGIPADKFEFIFEKFTKLKQSGENQTFTGAGIGLYVAKQLANELKGDILVQSEPGKGSTFSFVQF